MNRILVLLSLAVLVGCSRESDDSSAQSESGSATAPAPAADSTHAGHAVTAPDSPHAGHGAMASDSGHAPGSMAGMDHSAMQPARQSASAGAGHEMHAPPSGSSAQRIDHSRMNMPAAGTANAADHATMAGMTQHQPRTADSIMDHAAHTPAPGSVSATDKLMTLARALLSDSAVMRRIEADDSLRAAWSNPAVRQVLGRH